MNIFIGLVLMGFRMSEAFPVSSRNSLDVVDGESDMKGMYMKN
jgi:hypothetical protein